ncbi:hypothetical protein ACWCPQ_28100 [Nocardia sp. NPDC001965]
MGFWDGIGGDIVVGAVSVAGFAVGGPLGAAVAGGIAGGVASGFKGENILLGAGLGVAGGMVGGLGGVAFRGAAKGMVGGFLRQGHSLDLARALGGSVDKVAFERSGLFMHRIPELLGGSHLSPWKTYMGLLNTMATPYYMDQIQGFPDEVMDKWHKYMGYPDIELIDISEQELSPIPDRMPHIMMPDPNRLPEGLALTPPMEANYRTVPGSYAEYWKSFGEKPGKLELPKELEVSDISGAEKAGIQNYPQRVEKLQYTFTNLKAKAAVVAKANDRTSELCGAGRSDFSGVVKALEAFAKSDPRDMKRIGTLCSEYAQKATDVSNLKVFTIDPAPLGAGVPSEDGYAFLLVEAAYDNAEIIMTAYAAAFDSLAAQTEAEKPGTETGAQQTGAPQTTTNTGNGAADPYYAGAPTSTWPTARPSPSTVAAPTPWNLTSDKSSGAGADRPAADVPGVGNTGVDGLGAASSTPDVASLAAAAAPAVSAAGNGMGSALQSMMLPMLMQAMMGRNRQGAQDDLETGRREGRERQEDGSAMAIPAPAATPTPATPATQSPGQPTAPPPGDAKPVSARPEADRPQGKPVPATAPEKKGNVTYTFPDSRTQEVSAVVARALDAAFGNAAGTDARAAYTGTPAEWSDPKRIGRRIDPSETMTGDVGAWEDRFALLVQFDGQDLLEAVVDGALMQLADLSQMRDGAGEFGGFVGLFHPPGIEKVADESAVTTVPAAPVDQTDSGAVVSL